jgi:hypothetical protein
VHGFFIYDLNIIDAGTPPFAVFGNRLLKNLLKIYIKIKKLFANLK